MSKKLLPVSPPVLKKTIYASLNASLLVLMALPASANQSSVDVTSNRLSSPHISAHQGRLGHITTLPISVPIGPLPPVYNRYPGPHNTIQLHGAKAGFHAGDFGPGPHPGGLRLDLDLSSSNANIVLGKNLFKNVGAITIDVGGTSQTFVSGSKVTAAEYVAIMQKASGSEQTLILDKSGTATAGSFAANGIISRQDCELLIPNGVTMVDNFAAGRSLGISGDLFNYGSILATTTDSGINSGTIFARDIFNGIGGSISTAQLEPRHLPLEDGGAGLGLNLRAFNNINNLGGISSSGALSLSTNTGDISNSTLRPLGFLGPPVRVPDTGSPVFLGSGLISANGDISINAGGSVFNNATISTSHDRNINITAFNGISNQGSIISDGALSLSTTAGDITNNRVAWWGPIPLASSTANAIAIRPGGWPGPTPVLSAEGAITINAGGSFSSNGAISNDHGNITISSVRDLTNSGTITSAGVLSLLSTNGGVNNTAAPVIYPPMQAGPGTAAPMFIPVWSGPPPEITAVGDINITAGNGQVNNNGYINATHGSINIGSTSDTTNMQIDAMWGNFSAANGNINVRSPLYAGSADINMIFGNYTAHNLNLYSGSGTISGGVQQVDANINTVAKKVDFNTNVPVPLVMTNNLIQQTGTVSR